MTICRLELKKINPSLRYLEKYVHEILFTSILKEKKENRTKGFLPKLQNDSRKEKKSRALINIYIKNLNVLSCRPEENL